MAVEVKDRTVYPKNPAGRLHRHHGGDRPHPRSPLLDRGLQGRVSTPGLRHLDRRSGRTPGSRLRVTVRRNNSCD